MLRDAASFALHHVGAAQGIEQRGLAVVDVTHDGHDRRARLQIFRLVFDIKLDGTGDRRMHRAATAFALLQFKTETVLGANLARNLFVDPPNLREWTPHPVYTFVRRQLPPSAKLMLLDINHGFFLDREYIADSFFEASQMNMLMLEGGGNASELSRRLRARGITHVLLSTDDWEIPYPPALGEFLSDRRLTELMYSCPDRTCFLFRIR